MTISNVKLEKDLLYRLKEGDHAAFEVLYYKYSPQLLHQIDRKLLDPAQSDDIVQELFVKLWERRDQINPEKSFAGYLYRIAHRMLMDHYRKVAQGAAIYKEIEQDQSRAVNFTEEGFEVEEAQKIVEEAMERLTPQQKRTFQLCKIQGKSYKEAAEIMEISPETVHVHLGKATMSVKSYFRQQHLHISGPLALALVLSGDLYLNFQTILTSSTFLTIITIITFL